MCVCTGQLWVEVTKNSDCRDHVSKSFVVRVPVRGGRGGGGFDYRLGL